MAQNVAVASPVLALQSGRIKNRYVRQDVPPPCSRWRERGQERCRFHRLGLGFWPWRKPEKKEIEPEPDACSRFEHAVDVAKPKHRMEERRRGGF